jgi:hypothetical protein
MIGMDELMETQLHHFKTYLADGFFDNPGIDVSVKMRLAFVQIDFDIGDAWNFFQSLSGRSDTVLTAHPFNLDCCHCSSSLSVLWS